jgi:type IV secretion system protein VirB5
MFSKYLVRVLALCVLAFATVHPAHAQFAVIDVASLGQLIQEVQQLSQQVATAKSQLSQAQSEYAAITGTRGMQSLLPLSGAQRNYLPTDWSQLSQVIAGSPGSYPSLASSMQSIVQANAILTPTQVSSLSPTEQAHLVAARQAAALLQVLSRTALQNSSGRFAELQALIGAIGSAADQKASLDLNARIAAEQGMLSNESTKLQVLYQMAQSQQWVRAQRAQEQALADQGSLRALPAMGL